MSLYLKPYGAGDAARIAMAEPCPDYLRHGHPRGSAYTLVDARGVPVACIGFWEKGATIRVWARLDERLGPSSKGRAFRRARTLLNLYEGQRLTAHAGDAITGRLFERFGFQPADGGPFPRLYVREHQ